MYWKTLLFNFTLTCQNWIYILCFSLLTGSMFDYLFLYQTRPVVSPFNQVASTVPTVFEFLIRYFQRLLFCILFPPLALNIVRIFHQCAVSLFSFFFFYLLLVFFVYFLRACTSFLLTYLELGGFFRPGKFYLILAWGPGIIGWFGLGFWKKKLGIRGRVGPQEWGGRMKSSFLQQKIP